MPTNFYGKSSILPVPISGNILNANLRTLATAAGWDGVSAVSVTIGAGVYVWSDSTSVAALTIDGSWPNGATVVNNGYIMGMGGEGGKYCSPHSNGDPGGPAISVCSSGVTITNNSFIAGGGGGGAYWGGGGAGGGKGGGLYNSIGGAGGAIGQSGSNGYNNLGPTPGGGGGGRVVATGVAGNSRGNGNSQGGNGSMSSASPAYWSKGGQGNSPGIPANGGGGGGGWGAPGGNGANGTVGGAGGKAISLNGFTVTRSGSGTTYGAVS
jgi:hypothetical protein